MIWFLGTETFLICVMCEIWKKECMPAGICLTRFLFCTFFPGGVCVARLFVARLNGAEHMGSKRSTNCRAWFFRCVDGLDLGSPVLCVVELFTVLRRCCRSIAAGGGGSREGHFWLSKWDYGRGLTAERCSSPPARRAAILPTDSSILPIGYRVCLFVFFGFSFGDIFVLSPSVLNSRLFLHIRSTSRACTCTI